MKIDTILQASLGLMIALLIILWVPKSLKHTLSNEDIMTVWTNAYHQGAINMSDITLQELNGREIHDSYKEFHKTLELDSIDFLKLWVPK